MDVTIAICTFNRSDLLRQTLARMVEAMAIPAGLRWHVLVIDNNSTDQTAAVVEEFRAKLPISRTFESQPGLSRARNRALAECDADFIVFTDDDVLVDERWLTAFVEATRQFPDVDAWGGPIVPWYPIPPRPEYVEAFPALKRGFCGLDNGDQDRVLRDGEEIFGANMAFRMSAVRAMRFDTALGVSGRKTIGGEETEFVERLRRQGGRVAWVTQMVVQHYVAPARMQLSYLLKYTISQGQAWVLRFGVPPERRLFGAPRWVWRRTAGHALAAAWAAVRFRRIEALTELRQTYYFAGIVSSCRVRSREANSHAGWSDLPASGPTQPQA